MPPSIDALSIVDGETIAWTSVTVRVVGTGATVTVANLAGYAGYCLVTVTGTGLDVAAIRERVEAVRPAGVRVVVQATEL